MSIGWTPHGTFGGGAALAFPGDVLAAAAAQDLAPELVHLAWEIARLAPPASAAEGRALLLLALAVLAAQRDGSTRLPLAAAGPLPALLETLGASADDQRAVTALLAAAGAGEPRLRSLFGTAAAVGLPAPAATAPAGAPAGASSPGGAVPWALPAVDPGEGDYRPLLQVGSHLYAQRLWQLERRVVARLRDLLAAPSTIAADAVEAALADLRARPALDGSGRPVPLAAEQEAAVRTALAGRLTAITGGPGTGKTWIVAALLRVVARLGDPPLAEIALAAPTGKAADRLQGSLRAALAAVADPAEADRQLLAAPLPATTLHRLLSYSPTGERFLRHERNPLAERLVLVDESSMLDLGLAERLLRSLPEGGRLVLLGDARQLPSVDAGAVFRDLVLAAGDGGRIATLTRSWRMDPRDPAGSAILALAAGIAEGRAVGSASAAAGAVAMATPAAGGSTPAGSPAGSPAASGPAAAASLVVRRDAAELAFSGAELLLSPPAPLAAFLARWWERQVVGLPGWAELVGREWTATGGLLDGAQTADLAALFAHHEASRLLSATRGWSGGTGVSALNDWFRATLVRTLGLGGTRRATALDDAPLAGEPVLVTRNDYRRALYNGDHGVVLHVAAEGEPASPMAVLRAPRAAGSPPSFRALPLAALRGHLEPAWASTVHKAQGSEHDAVAVILPGADTRLLTRELLYTAVTRARRSVILVGTSERLDAAAARAVERWSGIAEALQATRQPSSTGAAASPGQLPLPF